MKFIEDLPTPAWVGLVVASIRVLLDWRHGVPIWVNIQRVVVLYVVSGFVSWLAFAIMVQPGVAMTGRDIAICAVITFFGVNIVYSFKRLGEDMEKNPLKILSTLVALWVRPGHLPESVEEGRDEHEGPAPEKPKSKGKKR